MAVIKHFRDLNVYQSAMDTCMEIFRITKVFPNEERFSLTDQIRRSSRSVCANIGSAWRKRRYRAAFISKLSDAEEEAGETQVWLEVALKSGYLGERDFLRLDDVYDKILGQIVKMIDEPEKWTLPSRQGRRPNSRNAEDLKDRFPARD